MANNLQNAFIDKDVLNIYDISVFNEISNQAFKYLFKKQKAIISAVSISDKINWVSTKLAFSVLNYIKVAK